MKNRFQKCIIFLFIFSLVFFLTSCREKTDEDFDESNPYKENYCAHYNS